MKYCTILLLSTFIIFSSSCRKHSFDEDAPSVEWFEISSTVTPDGFGTISLSPEGPYRKGDLVSIKAIAGDDYAFVRWDGDVEGTDNLAETVVVSDISVTAVFRELTEEEQATKSSNPDFYFADNDITLKCPAAKVGDVTVIQGVTYTKRAKEEITPENASTTCTSGITSFQDLFRDEAEFNEDISKWDASSVTTMADMFNGAKVFNADISAWDVSKVTSLTRTFAGAEAFNVDIGEWQPSDKLLRLTSTFDGAKSFNVDISGWDVSGVKFMDNTFRNATSFNVDLSGWCVPNITAKPSNFNTGSAMESNVAFQPVWGTCP